MLCQITSFLGTPRPVVSRATIQDQYVENFNRTATMISNLRLKTSFVNACMRKGENVTVSGQLSAGPILECKRKYLSTFQHIPSMKVHGKKVLDASVSAHCVMQRAHAGSDKTRAYLIQYELHDGTVEKLLAR